MDVKDEDRSDESKKNHMSYYKSLTRIISEIQDEKNHETEPAIKEHLESRIDAMEKDKKRIRDMFPDTKKEEWYDYTN